MSLHMSEDRRPSPKHSQMNKVTVCLIFSHRLYRKDVHSFQVWKEKMMQIVLNLHFFPLMASLRQLIQLQKEIQLNWSLWKKNSPRLCRTVTSVNTFLMSLWSQLLVSSLNKYNMTLGKSCPLYWKKRIKLGVLRHVIECPSDSVTTTPDLSLLAPLLFTVYVLSYLLGSNIHYFNPLKPFEPWKNIFFEIYSFWTL